MAFSLLILLTAIYLIRPADWIPALAAIPLFQLTILPCLVLSAEACSKQLTSRTLRAYPVSFCVFGLLAVAFASQIVNAPGAIATTFGFSKACIFYLLLVTLVNSQERLNAYLYGLGLILSCMGLLLLLNQQGIISTGPSEPIPLGQVRAEALGGQNFDANDTAAILVPGILIAFHQLFTLRAYLPRIFWLGCLLVTLTGLKLTDSRGGFIALMIGVAAYIVFRWGKKGIMWGSLLLPLAAAQFATQRMTDVNAINQGTGQQRVQLWHDGLMLLKLHPIFGIGPDEFTNFIGKAAHNSFVQAYAELGFAGGTLFVGAFYFAIATLYRIHHADHDDESEQQFLHPSVYVVFSILAGYPLAIFMLNHLYGTSTYLVLGLATATVRINAPDGYHEPFPIEVLLKKLLVVSLCFLIAMKIAAEVLVSW